MTFITTYLTQTVFFTKTKVALAFIFGGIGVAIGGYDAMKQALFILIILDFVLGFYNAWQENNLSRSKMHLGMMKIVGYCLTLIVLNYTSIAIGGLNINGFGLIEFGVSYLALNEGLSALKHLSKMGVPIPNSLINKIENYKDNMNKGIITK